MALHGASDRKNRREEERGKNRDCRKPMIHLVEVGAELAIV
jgi:hypothetical protein